MKTAAMCVADIEPFLVQAGSEGWIAEAWELEFLLDTFPAGCLVVRDEHGQPVAFVTSLKHNLSGWIGNLIVAPEYRGKGIGELLFLAALLALREASVETVWLTASRMGMGLYRRHGFHRIDTILRWSGVSNQGALASPDGGTRVDGVALDALAWGDRRDALLERTMARGVTICDCHGLVTVQPCGSRFQLGSFIALDQSGAHKLLEAAQQLIPTGSGLYLDTPASNQSATRLYQTCQLRITGTNELMYFGVPPSYRPELLYGMATMGSCG